MIPQTTATFAQEMARTSGQDILSCYQCKKCSAGCPVGPFDDILPNEVHRFIQLGKKEALLRCSEIWLCTGCETCGERCPNDINTAKVNDALKQMAVREGVQGKEKNIAIMHSVFLSGIRKRGRMHEITLMKDMRLRTGGYFKDLKLGIKMFRLGKLSLYAERVKKIKETRALFARAKELT